MSGRLRSRRSIAGTSLTEDDLTINGGPLDSGREMLRTERGRHQMLSHHHRRHLALRRYWRLIIVAVGFG
jgi:hypothetical protein